MNPEARSALMARIGSKNTKPELIVRKLVYSMGYRYRLHKKDLPGRPDIVFAARKKLIFIHGCFWHAHSCKRGFKPKTNVEFWNAKLQRNIERDQETLSKLKSLGWQSLVIWECEIKDLTLVEKRVRSFIEGS
ncbi:very short patch repair endonuclease [Massilia timonae]|uniref:very short patch repair endonuclease n=1 Tax=Massilia timonae TaxID=47229 RepID=UPI0009F449A2|nr:very short patch repair endonuclease [Massilia timonae]